MKNKILVSIVSEQTIPNVELIKEFKEEIKLFVFISTQKVENQLSWILNTVKLENYKNITVDAFNQSDILSKLNEFNYGNYEIILNVTGGTKLMSLVALDFYKNLGSTVYYLTGKNKEYIKLFPNRGEQNFVLTAKLSLNEYLTANGFSIKPSSLYQSKSKALEFLSFFSDKNKFESIKPILKELQKLRSKKNFLVNDVDNLSELLENLNFKTNEEELTKYDARYITGDWFEEYIYYRIKEELNINDDEIGIGYNLTKNNVPNEIDVLFIYNHKLYIVECKTSFYDYRLLADGKERKVNLLGEIIYKSDALRSKFGLFASTYIITLGEIEKDEDGKAKQNFEIHLNRAELSRINIIAKTDILSNKNMKELLKIN